MCGPKTSTDLVMRGSCRARGSSITSIGTVFRYLIFLYECRKPHKVSPDQLQDIKPFRTAQLESRVYAAKAKNSSLAVAKTLSFSFLKVAIIRLSLWSLDVLTCSLKPRITPVETGAPPIVLAYIS